MNNENNEVEEIRMIEYLQQKKGTTIMTNSFKIFLMGVLRCWQKQSSSQSTTTEGRNRRERDSVLFCERRETNRKFSNEPPKSESGVIELCCS